MSIMVVELLLFKVLTSSKMVQLGTLEGFTRQHLLGTADGEEISSPYLVRHKLLELRVDLATTLMDN